MGTPHVHCMSHLPTAHEPAESAAGQVPVTVQDSKAGETYASGRRTAAAQSGPAADVAIGVRAAV
jgi:hypothetical protein